MIHAQLAAREWRLKKENTGNFLRVKITQHVQQLFPLLSMYTVRNVKLENLQKRKAAMENSFMDVQTIQLVQTQCGRSLFHMPVKNVDTQLWAKSLLRKMVSN